MLLARIDVRCYVPMSMAMAMECLVRESMGSQVEGCTEKDIGRGGRFLDSES